MKLLADERKLLRKLVQTEVELCAKRIKSTEEYLERTLRADPYHGRYVKAQRKRSEKLTTIIKKLA